MIASTILQKRGPLCLLSIVTVILQMLILCFFTLQHNKSSTASAKKQMMEVKPIACDNPSCKFEWFHFQCVGLQEEEDFVGEWFCPSCTLAPLCILVSTMYHIYILVCYHICLFALVNLSIKKLKIRTKC